MTAALAHPAAPLYVEARVRGPSGAQGARFAALDGLRGLAILMVLFVHFIGDAAPRSAVERALVKLANYGVWGVDLFFVLSGFLITGILYDDRGTPHALRNFYARRTLRIFPIYFGILLVLFGILPALSVRYPAGLAEAARHEGWLWTYTCNVYLARAGTWALPYVSHFWSLAVEEHFYLLWPLAVLHLTRDALLRLSALGAVSALALRCALSLAGATDVTLTVLTPCRLDALLVGAALALVVREKGIAPVARAARHWLLPLATLVILASAWNAATQGLLREVVLPVRGTLIAVFFGALIASSVVAPHTSGLGRLANAGAARFLGKYSYGLYVFHGVIAYALQEGGTLDALGDALGSHLAAMLVQATLGAAASLAIAVASYELYEKHFLRLKDRCAPRETSTAAPGPTRASV
jgi:peptidoglycan/LPS O-acetylase OafA/YrhL